MTTKSRIDPELEHNLLKKQHFLREDYLWIVGNKTLRSEFENKFIVVKNKKVVYSDKSLPRLLRKITKSGERIDDFAVEYIRKHRACLLL